MERLVLLAFVAGSSIVQCLSALPPPWWRVGLPVLAIACAAWALRQRRPGARLGVSLTPAMAGRNAIPAPRRRLGIVLLCVSAALAGFAQASWRAQWRLDDLLAPHHARGVTRLNVQVDSLPSGDASLRRFEAHVLPGQVEGVPRRLAITWHAPWRSHEAVPEVKPGEVWRMALVLREPRGLMNPDGPDREAQMFARGLRATGMVRGQPRRLSDAPWSSGRTALARWRFNARQSLQPFLQGLPYGGVILALALGDQGGITPSQWKLFARTGITHLVAISGLHVGLVAGLAARSAGWAWRRCRWRRVACPEYLPASIVAATVGVLIGLVYCLFAGWGLPAQRTFFSLLVFSAAAFARFPLGRSRVLTAAAAAVTAIDPWATLSRGFWLSFGAVAWLTQIGHGRPKVWRFGPRSPWRAWLLARIEGARLQLTLTAALVPPLAYLVQTVSLGSPLANAIAIPLVAAVVTPAALVGAALAALPALAAPAGLLLQGAHAVFELAMWPVARIAQWPWTSIDVAAAPWPVLLLALSGAVYAIAPRGLPASRCGWLLMLPMLFWRGPRPEIGGWQMAALDIGQGSAVVVQTARHTLVFDTGPRLASGSDMGERVVWPYLRSLGVRRLDVLVVSHADLDHVGGVRGLLGMLPVARSYASFDLGEYLVREGRQDFADVPMAAMPARQSLCVAGTAWQMDGVAFEFLHPREAPFEGAARERNDFSCVLRVQGKWHALLLTGDIGQSVERSLAPIVPRTDLVMASHHGSRYSSAAPWIQALHAKHAFAQAGYGNRFGHPAAAVQTRWLDGGAWVWRTDLDGAVLARSEADGLRVEAQRDLARRYWHAVDPTVEDTDR